MIYHIIYRQGSVEFSIDPFLWVTILFKQTERELSALTQY